RLQMRKSAELAEARGGFLEIKEREGVDVGAVGLDAKPVEESMADQMRRLALHRADSEVDVRLAEKHRLQLRMGIGHVQDARIAEAREIVNAGAARRPWPSIRERGDARELEKIPAADGHAMSPRGSERAQWIS